MARNVGCIGDLEVFERLREIKNYFILEDEEKLAGNRGRNRERRSVAVDLQLWWFRRVESPDGDCVIGVCKDEN